ncbi:unnamed protein product [Paramecium sonneborni]|uniref:H-type lectin domain-containing protein n=1 Tax=Paramecium sonneborni TaxID=65129 RepID=A0A8S1R5F1_9CILI|nr:unnamed protein product [Paramecium sonneborni]
MNSSLVFFLIITHLNPTLGYIKYDTGYFKQMDYRVAGFACMNSFSKSYTIAFSGTFLNIPQVFLILDDFDLHWGTQEYQLSITSITLTNFDVFIKCIAEEVYIMFIRWYAIDDNRIQVINSFNLADPPTSKIFNHQLPNAVSAIVSPISLSLIGQLDFVSSVSQLTSTTVTISISYVAGKFENLKQLGYQIILGSNEMLNIIETKVITQIYNSGEFARQKNSWLLVPVVGLQYSILNQTIRIRKVFTYTTTTASFSFTETIMCPNTFQIVWMTYITYKAMECQGMRISSKFNCEASARGPFYIQIEETNQIFNSIGVFSTTISSIYTSLQINIIAKCQNDKNMSSKFHKCNSCTSDQQTYFFNHYCIPNINQISYFTRFNIVESVNQQLSITITDTSCLIAQVFDNLVISNTNIVDVKLVQF